MNEAKRGFQGIKGTPENRRESRCACCAIRGEIMQSALARELQAVQTRRKVNKDTPTPPFT